jgi:hypothetical protein
MANPLHRPDQAFCQVQVFGVSRDKVHAGDVCLRRAQTGAFRWCLFGGAAPKPRPEGLRPPDPPYRVVTSRLNVGFGGFAPGPLRGGRVGCGMGIQAYIRFLRRLFRGHTAQITEEIWPYNDGWYGRLPCSRSGLWCLPGQRAGTLGIEARQATVRLGANPGQVVDVANASLANGAQAIQWNLSGAPNQMWETEATLDGYYRFKSGGSGKCLNVNGASTADGAPIVQFTCGGSPNSSAGTEVNASPWAAE